MGLSIAGEKLRWRRQQAGKSLRGLSKVLGVNRAHISRVETGQAAFSESLLDTYIESLGPLEPDENLDIVKAELRLLSGKPIGVTANEARALAEMLYTLRAQPDEGGAAPTAGV